MWSAPVNRNRVGSERRPPHSRIKVGTSVSNSARASRSSLRLQTDFPIRQPDQRRRDGAATAAVDQQQGLLRTLALVRPWLVQRLPEVPAVDQLAER
jgi:hypothetical protein